MCARFITADVDFGDCRKSKELQDHKNMVLLSGQSATWISQNQKVCMVDVVLWLVIENPLDE